MLGGRFGRPAVVTLAVAKKWCWMLDGKVCGDYHRHLLARLAHTRLLAYAVSLMTTLAPCGCYAPQLRSKHCGLCGSLAGLQVSGVGFSRCICLTSHLAAYSTACLTSHLAAPCSQDSAPSLQPLTCLLCLLGWQESAEALGVPLVSFLHGVLPVAIEGQQQQPQQQPQQQKEDEAAGGGSISLLGRLLKGDGDMDPSSPEAAVLEQVGQPQHQARGVHTLSGYRYDDDDEEEEGA